MEVGIFKGVRDDANLERIFRGVANGETYAVYCHAAFVYREITTARHVGVVVVLERVNVRALRVLKCYTFCRFINVSLHDVTVQASVHHHRALHVYQRTYLKATQIRATERFEHCRNDIGITFNFHYGKAHTIVRHTLVNLQL